MPDQPEDDQTRPTQPPLRSEQATFISDLSGAPTQITPLPAQPTTLTRAPGDVQDAIPTHLSTPPQPPSGTDVTNLHVGSGPAQAAEGTHLGETWGDFQFSRLLGRGGMGAVYLGKQISLDRQVAIKVLPSHLCDNEQFRERFQLEAKAVAKMSSPHVVQVYAAGVHRGHHYFAMEFVDGEDLSRRLRAGFKPSYRQSLDLVVQAAKGLAAAGEHGIVHRDIKPGNMMIDRKGSLKIMDFGLVRLATAAHSLTMSGTVMGTVSYFSPEQGRGEPCDQRTDLYALGVVFYELLTGRLPFTGENATSVIYQHIHAPPKAPRELDPNIPEPYQAVVLKCMQKRADDRYASAAELLSDLERLVAGQLPAIALERPDLLQSGATIIGSGSFRPPAGASPRRRSAAPKLLAAVAVLAAVGGALWWHLRPPPPIPVPIVAAPPVPLPPIVVQPDPQQAAAYAQLERRMAQDKALRETVAQADALAVQGRFADAEQVLAEYMAANPGDREIQAALDKVRSARTQAEARAAAVAAAAVAAVQNPQTTAPGADPALASARAALAGGDLQEARRIINFNRGQKADDPEWAAVAKELDVAEGRQILRAAQDAFARGNIDFAGSEAMRAKALIPEDPALVRLLADIEQIDGRRKQLDRALHEAENLLTEGQPAKAESMLAELAKQWPDDPRVAGTLRRATAEREKAENTARRVQGLIDNGTAALTRGDLDAANLAFTSASQMDARSEAAGRGLALVRERKEAIAAAQKRVEVALQASDIGLATRELAELERLAPGSPQAVFAASQVNLAQAKAAEERTRAEALERVRQDKVKLLTAQLDDLTHPVPPLAEAIEAFAAEAGAERPELADLRRRLDDRRSRAEIGDLLKRFDAAVAARDATALSGVFADGAEAAAPFVAFMAMPGARLATALTGFARDGDAATVDVALTHAMDNAPEERQALRWTVRRAAGTWRIAAAALVPAGTP